MDDTSAAIIEKIKITYPEPKEIRPGKFCRVYYDCIQLTPNELARLGAVAFGERKTEFDIAVGIAYQGILFAAALAAGQPVSILTTEGEIFGVDITGKRILLVSDVIHSGTQMQKAQEKVESQGGKVVAYACIVDRSNGEFGSDEIPLYSALSTKLN